MGNNSLPLVLVGGSIAAAASGHIRSMVVLFILACAVSMWQNAMGWALLAKALKKRNQ